MAAANHKLTTAIAGRTLSGTANATGETTLTFSDGSKLTAKTAPSSTNSATNGGTVSKVRQSVEPPALHLDMKDGSTLEIALAEATSSVMLRDKDGNMEYAD